MIEGVIEDELPRGLYAVRSDDGRRVTASLPVRSRHGMVSIRRGVRVKIEVSERDASRARILGLASE